MKKYITEIIIVVIFALLFGISAVISHRSAKTFVMCAAFGAFCGVAGLPYLDKRRWKDSLKRDIVAGILAASVIAYSVGATLEGYLLALTLGIFAGIFGGSIAKHAPLP